MTPLELIQDPEAMAGMTVGELLTAGLQIAIVGMLIVFVLLLILLAAVKLIEKIYYRDRELPRSERKQAAGERGSIPDSPAGEPAAAEEAGESGLSGQKVAAIVGALMVFCGDSGKKYKILRVKKLNRASGWQQKSRSQEYHQLQGRSKS